MNQRTLLFLFFCSALLSGRSAYACSLPSPESSASFTTDMAHVLVMLAEGSANGFDRKYDTSGMYRLDGSTDPVWTVDWLNDSDQLFSDGRYIVSLGAVPNKPNHVLSFYDNGEFLREYKLGDLFEDVGKFDFGACGLTIPLLDHTFDEYEKLFMLATQESVSYTFSVATGEILGVEEYSKDEYEEKKKAVKRKRLNGNGDDMPASTIDAVAELVEIDEFIAKTVRQPYLSNKLLIERIVGTHGGTYHFFDKSLRNSKRLSRLAVSSGRAIKINMLDKYKNDRDVVTAAVNYDGHNYALLPKKLKNDKKLLLGALSHGGLFIYNSAPENLRKDKDVLVEALRSELALFKEYYNQQPNVDFTQLDLIPAELLMDDQVKHSIDAVIDMYVSGQTIETADKIRRDVYSRIRLNSGK